MASRPYSITDVKWMQEKVNSIPTEYLYKAGLTPEDVLKIRSGVKLSYLEAKTYAEKLTLAEQLMKKGGVSMPSWADFRRYEAETTTFPITTYTDVDSWMGTEVGGSIDSSPTSWAYFRQYDVATSPYPLLVYSPAEGTYVPTSTSWGAFRTYESQTTPTTVGVNNTYIYFMIGLVILVLIVVLLR